MKKIYLLMFVVLFVSMISATSTTWGTYKQNSCVNIVSICPLVGCNETNITKIVSPTSSILATDVSATHNENTWNYSFCNTSELGTYNVYGLSDNGTKTIYFVGDFEVNTSGATDKSFLFNPILIFLTLFALVFIMLGISVKVPALGFIGSILLILAGIYTMIYGFGNVANLYTQGIAITLIGIGFIFMFSSAYEWFSLGESSE